MTEPRRSIYLYYAYRACTSFGFYVPVSVVYVLDQGYGLGFVALLQATFSLGLLVAEIPTGYLGDRIGRRASLAVGNACRVVGLLGYVVADARITFLALKVIFALGWAFRSGTKNAWLYEVLAVRYDEDEYARIESRGNTLLLATSAVTAIAGSLLYGLNTAFPFVANAALAAMTLPILATFPAVETDAADEGTLGVGDAVRVLRLQVRRPEIRWLVAYATLIFLVFDVSRTFEQPALEAAGVPLVGFGLVYAGFKLAAAGAASTAGWLHDRLGARGVLGLAAPVLAIGYASLAILPPAIVPVLFGYRCMRAIVRPARNQYLNDRLDDVGRATVLSSVSMVLSLAGVVARLGAGAVAAVVGPIRVLTIAGVGIAGGAGVLWLAVSPVREATGKDSRHGEVTPGD